MMKHYLAMTHESFSPSIDHDCYQRIYHGHDGDHHMLRAYDDGIFFSKPTVLCKPNAICTVPESSTIVCLVNGAHGPQDLGCCISGKRPGKNIVYVVSRGKLKMLLEHAVGETEAKSRQHSVDFGPVRQHQRNNTRCGN